MSKVNLTKVELEAVKLALLDRLDCLKWLAMRDPKVWGDRKKAVESALAKCEAKLGGGE